MRLQASTTVEASLLFPLLFLYCMVFLQFGLLFAAAEYTKSVGNAAVIAKRAQVQTDEENREALLEKLGSAGLGLEEPALSQELSGFAGIRKITVRLSGTYRLFYPSRVSVLTTGYLVEADRFVRNVDLIWELAGKVKEAEAFKEAWYGG